MSGLTMYDTALNNQFPGGADAYAAYVDGGVGNQPNYGYVVSAFPKAFHLSVTIFGNDADCADVEAGAMGVGGLTVWVARQVARGVRRPVIYASVSTMESAVRPVVAALPGARAAVRLWTAHYQSVLGPHICGPSTCGQLGVDADGTQWTDSALGRVLDESLLRGDFFGSAPAPAVPQWQEEMMQALPTVREGSTGGIVRTVQGLCGARGHAVTVDGSFGPATLAAVKACQAAAKVNRDGIVGPVTWAVLVGVS